MKAENLRILQSSGIHVPPFLLLDAAEAGREMPDLSFSEREYFAVRSSCSGEDSDCRSHAGEYETLLNVKREEVGMAAGKVAASYGKKKSGYVIIQEMVNSEVSGVLFTANPLGILNEYCIVVGEGLGSHVVNDEIHTTAYHYNTDDQTYITIPNGDGKARLTEGQIRELVSLGKQIEEIFGRKMDIEFALEGGLLYILQARPITTLGQDGEEIILDNSNIVESYPGVSLPLTQSFVKDIYYRIFKNCLLRITLDREAVREMDDLLRDMVDTVNGRIYYRISNWYTILRLLPCSGRIIPVWQEMMGLQNSRIYYRKITVRAGTKLTIGVRFAKYLLTVPAQMKRLQAYFTKTLAQYRARYEKAADIEQLFALYEEAKEEFLRNWDITLINDMDTFLSTWMAGRGRQGAGRKLIAQVRELESMKPVTALEKLQALYDRDGEDSPGYKKAAAAYIAAYGDRIPEELKLETRTYRTDPGLLTAYLGTGSGADRRRAQQEKRAPARGGRQGFWVRRACNGIRNRERARLNRSRLFGFTRDIFLKIGGIMAAEGMLEQARDIFYLYDAEIAAGCHKQGALRDLVEKRRRQYEHFRKLHGFGRLVFHNTVLHELHYLGQPASLWRDDLQGTGISEGVVEGEALVMDTPVPGAAAAGRILVTRSTDPGWVFLIRDCLGVVAEQGSLLSHTAIISRELKKPAVVNVRNATKLLRTGERIRVDGLAGTIERLGR